MVTNSMQLGLMQFGGLFRKQGTKFALREKL
jgi:hypothetical protein